MEGFYMFKWWPFRKKETPQLVQEYRCTALDNKSLVIKARSEEGFWRQTIYQELLLTPDEFAEKFDIADLIVKTKARRHRKKFRRQAASILHERRSQWQLYEVEVHSVQKVELKYFNYRTENRGTITLDLTRPCAVSKIAININGAKLGNESSCNYQLSYLDTDDPNSFIVRQIRSDDAPNSTYTFEDNRLWESYPYYVDAGED